MFRVAAVYGGAAFVLLQVADLLQDGLQLPQTFLTVSTVAVLAGFPVALLLASPLQSARRQVSEAHSRPRQSGLQPLQG